MGLESMTLRLHAKGSNRWAASIVISHTHTLLGMGLPVHAGIQVNLY